jgi:hypothetical protein
MFIVISANFCGNREARGTGKRSFGWPAISARFAPLPPNRFFIDSFPSALLPPKEYTYFVGLIFFFINDYFLSNA